MRVPGKPGKTTSNSVAKKQKTSTAKKAAGAKAGTATGPKKAPRKAAPNKKMPPELLERFKGKSAAKTEAKGEKAGADKKKGGPKDAKMMGMKKGSGPMAKARAARKAK